MKVKISETVDVSDEQRLAIAKLLHGENAKKDHATREELKEFVWKHGRDFGRMIQSATDYQPEIDWDGMDLI